jgi:uncharacterized protein
MTARQTIRVLLNDFPIMADVATTEEELAQGLLGRTHLEEDEGMLFVLQERAPFHMRGMQFPIDIIWIDRDHKITAVFSNAQPCLSVNCPEYFPDVDFSYVLEVQAGLAKRLGLSSN